MGKTIRQLRQISKGRDLKSSDLFFHSGFLHKHPHTLSTMFSYHRRMKIKVTKLYLAALLLLLMGACSRQQERPEPEAYFATHTDENGHKLFQYSLDYPASGNNKRGSKGGSQSRNAGGHIAGNSSRGVSGGVAVGSLPGRSGRRAGGKNGSNSQQAITTRLENMLEQELKTTGYCPEGYKELERMVAANMVYIRGECNENATSEDTAMATEGSEIPITR